MQPGASGDSMNADEKQDADPNEETQTRWRDTVRLGLILWCAICTFGVGVMLMIDAWGKDCMVFGAGSVLALGGVLCVLDTLPE